VKRIIIWGTSLKAKRILHFLNYAKVEIIGFSDNNFTRSYIADFINGYPYIPGEDILQEKYDYIVIASSAFCEITDQLLFCGVSPEKIIQAYNCQYMLSDALFFFNKPELDEKKYEIFTRFSTFCFGAGVGHI